MNRVLVIFLSVLTINVTALAASPECISIKSNNASLGLFNDFMSAAQGSAQVVIKNLENQNSNEEFLGFHLGYIEAKLSSLDNVFIRNEKQAPLLVLPEENEKLRKASNWERRYRWTGAINCYRRHSNSCDDRISAKDQLVTALKDLISAADDVTNSNSVKTCYLRD